MWVRGYRRMATGWANLKDINAVILLLSERKIDACNLQGMITANHIHQCFEGSNQENPRSRQWRKHSKPKWASHLIDCLIILVPEWIKTSKHSQGTLVGCQVENGLVEYDAVHKQLIGSPTFQRARKTIPALSPVLTAGYWHSKIKRLQLSDSIGNCSAGHQSDRNSSSGKASSPNCHVTVMLPAVSQSGRNNPQW